MFELAILVYWNGGVHCEEKGILVMVHQGNSEL